MDSHHPAPQDDAAAPEPEHAGGGAARTVELVAGDFLVTVNPVDGSQIESCPPGRRPLTPRVPLGQRAAGTGAPPPTGALPLVERDEERRQLASLLARGRSVRLTGPPGSGRSALVAAVADDCDGFAPDGVIRLSGHQRTASDLLHELYASVHQAPGYRPGLTELRATLREIGAVVVVDDIEFGGAGLDELLDATPECAFLITAHPGVPAPADGSRVEEIFLACLSRTACLEVLEHVAGRPVTNAESDWASDLWHDSEGLPQRFVQAGALLRHRGNDTSPLPDGDGLVVALARALPAATQEVLRFAVALGGTLPAPARLATLTGDPDAADAPALLRDGGLLDGGRVTTAGPGDRLASGVAADLAAAGLGEDAGDRCLAVAQHFAWWLAEPDGIPVAEAAAESEALSAVLHAAQRAGHASAVVHLARAVAPLLAGALQWGAWERALRCGQEASRIVGEVEQEAYFHHELGVLAICQGRLDRARTELEASIALRTALGERGRAVVGRRALALVDDLGCPSVQQAMETPPLGLGGSGMSSLRRASTVPAAGVPAPAEPPAEMVAGSKGATEAIPRQEAAAGAAVTPGGGDGGSGGEDGGDTATRSRARRATVGVAASGLLLAVLGTVVALGVTSDGGEDSPRDGDSGPASAEKDEPRWHGPPEPEGGRGGDDEPAKSPKTPKKPEPTPEKEEKPEKPPISEPRADDDRRPPEDGGSGGTTSGSSGHTTTDGSTSGTASGSTGTTSGSTWGGDSDGSTVDGGTSSPTTSGATEGGDAEGTTDGSTSGTTDGGDGGGTTSGSDSEGTTEGTSDGTTEGTSDGTTDGASDGGSSNGSSNGTAQGSTTTTTASAPPAPPEEDNTGTTDGASGENEGDAGGVGGDHTTGEFVA